MNKNSVKLIPPDIFKYASFEAGNHIIRDLTIRFSNPEDFNDPLDCIIDKVYFDFSAIKDPKIESELKQLKEEFKGYNLTNEFLSQAYRETQSAKLRKIAVTCFSLNWNNPLMWAHYANKHEGFCFHFDNSLDDDSKFKDVTLDIQGHVNYDLIGQINFCCSKNDGYKYIYLNKSRDWEYENEFRFGTLRGKGLYHFYPQFLKSIVFGLKIKKEEKLKTMEVCKNSELQHVTFFEAHKIDSDIIYTQLN